jgi:hypothetical protein
MIWKMPASSVSTAIALAVFHQHGLQALGCGVTSEQAWRPQLVRHVSSSRSPSATAPARWHPSPWLHPGAGARCAFCHAALGLHAGNFAAHAVAQQFSQYTSAAINAEITAVLRVPAQQQPASKGQRLDVAISKWSYHKAPLQHRGQHSQGYHDGQRGRRLGAL